MEIHLKFMRPNRLVFNPISKFIPNPHVQFYSELDFTEFI